MKTIKMGYNVHVSIERCQTMRWQNDCLQSVLTDYRLIGRKPVSETEQSGDERQREEAKARERDGAERRRAAARGSESP